MTAVLKYKHTLTACVSQNKLEWAAHLERKKSDHPSDEHTDLGNHGNKNESRWVGQVIFHALPNDRVELTGSVFFCLFAKLLNKMEDTR